MNAQTLQTVNPADFASQIVAKRFRTVEQAREWLGVLDGKRGTRHARRQATPQARLNSQAQAVQAGDQFVWVTDAEALRVILTSWIDEGVTE